jgi:F-type H+-transporting ATPase subunit gamma
MPNLRDIRRRIRGVRSTQQVTRAMKIVAAAKLRRSQERMLAARPYADRMLQVLGSLAARANPEEHPLLQRRGEEKVELVVLTADKGLCGAFNANILRRATAFLEENRAKVVSVHTIGRKGRDFFRRRGIAVTREWVDVFKKVEYAHAARIAADLVERYVGRDLDAVHLVYNEFKSVIQQRVVVAQLLPIPELRPASPMASQDYIYEPSAKALLEKLLPKHVEFQVLRALLESAAAEFAARMTAMDNATRNAGEMIQTLTLTMNRVRQASITREIIEVVSGAQAL